MSIPHATESEPLGIPTLGENEWIRSRNPKMERFDLKIQNSSERINNTPASESNRRPLLTSLLTKSVAFTVGFAAAYPIYYISQAIVRWVESTR